MLLDVLSELAEIKICTGYKLDGTVIDRFPSDAFLLERLPTDLRDARRVEDADLGCSPPQRPSGPGRADILIA